MNFLNPSILFGLIAVSIPILLHFLNLRKLKTIEFSTLIFLKELQKSKIKRIKLKQLILLIVRSLIIIFLVLAFSRPTLKTNYVSNSSANNSAVIIIDNTFSMSLINDKGSLLNQSKLIAKKLIDQFKEGDEVTVISIGELKKKKFHPTSNFSEINKQIDEIEISEVSNTINEAVVEATKILFQSNKLNKEIYLLTDMQKSRLYNSKDELSSYGKSIDERTSFYLFDFSNEDFSNLGIISFESENQIFELNKQISFSVKVKNYSELKSDNNVVSLFVNGKRSAQKNISLSSKETKDVLLETTLQDTGLVSFSAELEDDNILFDNQFYLSVNVKKEISVLILTDSYDDSKFVRQALELNPSIKIFETLSTQINSVNPSKYDMLILIAGANKEIENNINKIIDVNKNILVFPSSNATTINFSNIIKKLSNNYNFIEKGKINSDQIISEFGKVDFNHPLLKNIFLDEKKSKIESPSFNKYFQVNYTGKEKPIIEYVDKSPFLFEIKSIKNSILVFTSTPSLSSNDFVLKSFFAPLINRIIYYLAIKLKEEKIKTGNNFFVDLSKSTSALIKVEKPSNEVEFINKDSLLNKLVLNYNNTYKKGCYKFFSNDILIDFNDVNIDPLESENDKYSLKDFEEYLKEIQFGGKLFFIRQNENFRKIINESRFGIELWKYFLITALLLLIIESLISRSTKKDIINLKEV